MYSSFKEKEDDELFMVDATPLKHKQAVITERQKRKLNAKKPLRSLEALNNTSKVQDPIVKRYVSHKNKAKAIIRITHQIIFQILKKSSTAKEEWSDY